MDQTSLSERNFADDLESGGLFIDEPGTTYHVLDHTKSENTFLVIVSKAGEVPQDNVKSLIDKKLEGEECLDVVPEKTAEKENRKKTTGKKAPKPPRPPRGPSLDAADQKLIKEISELAMIKRARVERMKALKKMKAAKALSLSTSGNLFAMLFTVLFCLVVIFQGFSPQESSPISSPALAQASDGDLISVRTNLNPSDIRTPGLLSSNSVESVPSSDLGNKANRSAE